MLIGGEDFVRSGIFIVRARTGLGGAGDGRLGGDLVDVGDLISKRRIAGSLRVNVLLTICGDEGPSSPLAIAINAASYALFPKLLLTEEYVLSSASATSMESGELLFGDGSKSLAFTDTCCSGSGFLAMGFLGMT